MGHSCTACLDLTVSVIEQRAGQGGNGEHGEQPSSVTQFIGPYVKFRIK